MGCTSSKNSSEQSPNRHSKARTPRSTSPPTPHDIPLLPPVPPQTPRRKSSAAHFESPHRRWSRKQMGDELFHSATTTPERAPTLPDVDLPEAIATHERSHPKAPCGMNEYPPGTALPYKPDCLPLHQPDASSVYAETPATPPNRSHSYRSYSGRAMYSPARFSALSSSPYGTPTIRKVTRSFTDVKSSDSGHSKDDDAKTWLTETTVDDETFGGIRARSKI